MRSVTEEAELAIRLVKECAKISYDTETSGVDWKRNFPIGYIVSNGTEDGTAYVPVRHGGGGNLPDPNVQPPASPTDNWVISRFEQELAKAFDYRNQAAIGPTIGFNIKFDCHMSANAGIMLGRNLTDAQLNETMLDEYAKQYSLEASATRRGVQAKKGQAMYDHLANLFGGPNTKVAMANYWQTAGNDPIAVEYAKGDGVSTFELEAEQLKQIEFESLEDVWRMENELIWTIFRMERRGIKVDVDYLQRTQEEIRKNVKAAYDALPPNFNVRSSKQVREYLEAAGHTNWPITEKGNPSFQEKWLRNFDEGMNIIKVRKWTNLDNSFITPLIEEHVFNGRVHANLVQLKIDDVGTAARLSCTRPNLQAVPKRDKQLAPMFRRGFVADEGMLFFEDDWSQCEPRLFAHYSQEPALIEGYSQVPFRDMHAVVADLLNVERDPTAKRMNMGILTGMQAPTFAVHMGWDIEIATTMFNKWFRAFPGIREFQRRAKARILNRGYVKTVLGRRGRLDHARFAYKAVSKLIQGNNADIIKYKMVQIDKWIESNGYDDDIQLLMTIHDAFEGQFAEGKEHLHKEMVDMMEDVQSDPFNLRVPFVVDSGTGPNWAEATFGS